MAQIIGGEKKIFSPLAASKQAEIEMDLLKAAKEKNDATPKNERPQTIDVKQKGKDIEITIATRKYLAGWKKI